MALSIPSSVASGTVTAAGSVAAKTAGGGAVPGVVGGELQLGKFYVLHNQGIEFYPLEHKVVRRVRH